MLLTYTYRLYPTVDQIDLLNRHFGHTRYVYNDALTTYQSHYKETGKSLSTNTLINRLVHLKQELPWLHEVDGQSLQQAIINLSYAYKNFFSKRSRFPRFKSKYDRQSVRFMQSLSVNVDNSTIRVSKVGRIPAVIHRPISGKIKNITISRNSCGQYFASVLTDDGLDYPTKSYDGHHVGIDLGIKDLITTSDGVKVPNPKHFKKHHRNLKRKQQALARKKKNSQRRAKARRAVAKIHLKIANTRRDFLHQVSRKLVNENQVIVFETLRTKNLMKNKHLAHAIGTMGWNMLYTYASYKARREGKITLRCDPYYPSSKLCSCCGAHNSELKLSDREWTCSACHTHHDRDENAAINIRNWMYAQPAIVAAMKLN